MSTATPTEPRDVRLATIAVALFIIADEITEKVLGELEQLHAVASKLHASLVWEWMAAVARQLADCTELATVAAQRLHQQAEGAVPRLPTVAAAAANLRVLQAYLRDLEQRLVQADAVLGSTALADLIGRIAEVRYIVVALEGRGAAQEEELAAALALAPGEGR